MPSKPELDWRQTLYNQYVRLDKTKAILMIGLLVLNLSFTVYDFVAWRGLSVYAGVPIISLLIGILAILFANVWVVGFEFYKSEIRANILHNPMQTRALNPWQEQEFRVKRIPELKALRSIAKANGASSEQIAELDESIEKLERWVELGFIPDEDIPEHLEHHMLGEGERL